MRCETYSIPAIGVPTGRVLTLSWDDPERVLAGRPRTDARVKARTVVIPQVDIESAATDGTQSADYRLDSRAREYKRR